MSSAYTTLISAEALAVLLRTQPDGVRLFDCSFDLVDNAAGRRAYAAGHLPGARYLNLDEDLSSAKNGLNGRHPLPGREVFAQRVARWGVSDDTQVVAYDSSGGMYASRLWWMLRWAGHAAVAVLDGGPAAWKAQGLPMSTDTPTEPAPGRFTLRPSLAPSVDHATLRANLVTQDRLVVDARSADRFRGENETLDPVGGRIPGAVKRFFRDNLAADGRFKPAAQLRAEFETVTGGRDPATLVASCGSGVTACHDLLALEVAGLSGAALYPGSWSEWSAQPGAPVATGPA
jgi:thiosulfate/3-mercaptopyruvate sulfurtransferase